MLFNKKITAIILILILIGGGIWLYRKNQAEEEMVSPEITLEPTQQIVSELTLPMSEAEKQAIDDAFAKEGAEMTLLKDVVGGQGIGTAWRQYDGSQYYHKIEASNLTPLDKGYFYEGWLVGEDGFFSTGRMALDDSKGELFYSTEEDKTEFRGVVVTLEAEDGNSAPDKHVLEGSF